MGGFADIYRLHAELGRDISPGSAWLRSVGKEIEKEAQKVARKAAARDLGGDAKFSGWAPTLDTKVVVRPDAVIVSPTRTSAGPWTVAEDGRNQGNASGFAGPGINTRTGVTARTQTGRVTQRRRKGKRWNGRTRGKDTASQASAALVKAVQPVIDKAWAEQLKKRSQ